MGLIVLNFDESNLFFQVKDKENILFEMTRKMTVMNEVNNFSN